MKSDSCRDYKPLLIYEQRNCSRSLFEQPKQLGRAVNGGICGKWKNIISLSITGGTIIGRNKSRTVIDFHHSYHDKGRVAMQWWKWRGRVQYNHDLW